MSVAEKLRCGSCGQSMYRQRTDFGDRVLCSRCSAVELDGLRAQLAQAQADTRTVAAILGLLPAEYLDGTPDGQPYDAADAVRRVVMDFAQAQAEAAAMREVWERWREWLSLLPSDLSMQTLIGDIDTAISADAGRTFLERLQRAEAEADEAKRLRETIRKSSFRDLFERLQNAERSARAWQERAPEERRAGAEEMRERCAVYVETASILIPIEVWLGTKKDLTAALALELAKGIRALPLEPGKDGVA